MHIQSDAVTGSMHHATVFIGFRIRRNSNPISRLFNLCNHRFVNIFSGNTSPSHLNANTLSSTGKPKFELIRSPDYEDGSSEAVMLKTAKFGEKEWKQIVASGGRLDPVLRLLK